MILLLVSSQVTLNHQFCQWWCFFLFYWFGKWEFGKFTNRNIVIGGPTRLEMMVLWVLDQIYRSFSKNLLTSVSQYQTHSKLFISWLSKLGNINGLVLEVHCKIFASDLMVLFIKDLVNLPSIYLISLRSYLAFLVKNHQCQRNIAIWVYIDWFPVAVLLSFILLVVNGLM